MYKVGDRVVWKGRRVGTVTEQLIPVNLYDITLDYTEGYLTVDISELVLLA